mgnify:CR=1 FL=1
MEAIGAKVRHLVRLCGTFFSDMSDASGTMWMNTRERCWDESLLAACGLTKKHMPELVEGPQVTGTLLPELAQKWGMDEIPIVAGAGDNAAGAIGVGLTEPGQGMISLGTSGVYFVVADQFSSFPEKAVHSFCHALPDRWHLMSVMLSAASCLDWFAKSVLGKDVPAVLSLLENEDGPSENAPFFLPYLSGERTPHNDPNASGAFIGLTHQHSTKDMAYAVLEGVCFAMADGVDAVHASGTSANDICLIGGGTKSAYWRQLIADVLQRPVTYRQGGDVGTQYRSAIYTFSDEDLATAQSAKDVYEAAYMAKGNGKITTEIKPAPTYFPAEDYHQQYLAKNPQGYCGIGGTGVVCPLPIRT